MEWFGIGPRHLKHAGTAFQGFHQAPDPGFRQMAVGAGEHHIAPVEAQIDLPGDRFTPSRFE